MHQKTKWGNKMKRLLSIAALCMVTLSGYAFYPYDVKNPPYNADQSECVQHCIGNSKVRESTKAEVQLCQNILEWPNGYVTYNNRFSGFKNCVPTLETVGVKLNRK